MPAIDEYSLAAIPIQMFFNETELSLGTAFVWQAGNDHFLITNWHNVSGRNPNTGKHLSPTAAEPDRLRVWLNLKGRLGMKVRKDVLLRDANGAPVWFVHPKHRQQVDVVAIPIEPFPDVDLYPINGMEQLDIIVQVGVDVFVLGYPFGIGPAGFPIWKRGSIASEPELAGLDHLHIFLDTASRPGMSGSPVIRRSWSPHPLADGSIMASGGAATKFIGIYSGRLASSDPLDAQLGLTWPASMISEILAGSTRDT